MKFRRIAPYIIFPFVVVIFVGAFLTPYYMAWSIGYQSGQKSEELKMNNGILSLDQFADYYDFNITEWSFLDYDLDDGVLALINPNDRNDAGETQAETDQLKWTSDDGDGVKLCQDAIYQFRQQYATKRCNLMLIQILDTSEASTGAKQFFVHCSTDFMIPQAGAELLNVIRKFGE